MKDCCEKEDELIALRQSHENVLWIVLWINIVMFVAEVIVGFISHSTAVLADGADMLGDSLVYGFSLVAIRRTAVWQAKASLLKGLIMLMFGTIVLIQGSTKFLSNTIPAAEMMGAIGFAALLMNSVCFGVLWKYRGDNINMESTWVCSRNDLIANVGVLIAAFLTTLTMSKWPDVIVGLLIAGVFLKSALSVIRRSMAELARPTPVATRHNCEAESAEKIDEHHSST